MKPNYFSNTTSGPLVSPITPAQFADFMSLEYVVTDDALLSSFLLSATEMCIAYTNHELLQRTWEYRLDRSPEFYGGLGGLGRVPASLDPWINLPLTPVSSITGITVDGVAYTDFTEDLNSRPARVSMDDVGDDIVITYVAGVGTAADIDSRLLLGIYLLAQYLYDNRGCDVSKAVEMSGAFAVWYSVRMLIGGL